MGGPYCHIVNKHRTKAHNTLGLALQAGLAINRLGPCADARATMTAARSAECFYTMRVVNRLSLYIKFLQTTSCDTLTSTCENSPPLMPVQRSHPGPKSCPAAAIDPYHAGQTGRKRASCFAREANPPTHLAAHECSISTSPAQTASPWTICFGPALHGRSRWVSGRCGASRAGSWGGRRWATRPSAAVGSRLTLS